MFPRLNPIPPTIAFIALTAGCFAGEIRDRYAAVVDAYEKTPFVDEEAPFLDAERALGPPDGRTLALGIGASVTLRFFRGIQNGPGPDVRVHEIGADGARARVAVSEQSARFVELPSLATGSSSEYDLDALGEGVTFFVRIRGVDDLGIEPGFDLDAVEALH